MSRDTATETRLRDAVKLAYNITQMRSKGNRDPLDGLADEDLLDAIKGLEAAAREWRAER